MYLLGSDVKLATFSLSLTTELKYILWMMMIILLTLNHPLNLFRCALHFIALLCWSIWEHHIYLLLFVFFFDRHYWFDRILIIIVSRKNNSINITQLYIYLKINKFIVLYNTNLITINIVKVFLWLNCNIFERIFDYYTYFNTVNDQIISQLIFQ